ncbi:MAG: hypothetical protein ACRCZ0_09825 [Cetobacterium sp.]
MAKNEFQHEFQHRNKFLTLVIGNKTYQFKPIKDKDNLESINGFLMGDFTEKEIKSISKFDGVIKTK